MQVVRRLYLYAVSFISLMIMLAGASSLLRLLFIGVLDVNAYVGDNPTYQREEFSRNAALLVVGGVVWGIHWWLAQRAVSTSNPVAAEERNSVLRKLLLFGVM